MSIWDNPELEKQRDSRRKRSGRITFDCFNLKVRGERVYCAKGKLLGQARDGTLSLISVLRGITLGVCKTCEDFDGGEDEG